MSTLPEVRDMLALTHKYYARLRELLAEVPTDRLNWRPAGACLTASATIRHVCEADGWYMTLADGGSREAASPADDPAALRAALTETEAAMAAFLEGMDEAALERAPEVPGWWGEGRPQPVRLILMHSLAHKYYHCGQLQALLHAAADTKPPA